MTPEARRQAIEVIQCLVEGIKDLCKIKQEQGLPGIPSGEYYAHLMAAGISYQSYMALLAQLERAGVIKVKNNCIIYVEGRKS